MFLAAVSCVFAGTTIYFAPEVMTQAFDEHSDVWSLGCILFEMTTTFMYDMAKVVEKLDQIKKDAYILEEIFEEISKVNILLSLVEVWGKHMWQFISLTKKIRILIS